MRKSEIYLDTSVINFLFADDAPEKRDITIDLFENYIQNKVYDVYISPIVIDEIKILDILEKEVEIENLAYIYIDKNIIPKNKIEDALHISICSVLNIDYLLSWNYKHLANVNREGKIIAVNITEGYNKQLRIITPMEVIYE